MGRNSSRRRGRSGMRGAILQTAFRAVFISLLYLGMAPLFCGAATARGAATYGLDLSGQPVASLTDAQTRAVVLLFAASDCPISNRYLPQMRRLQSEFGPRHVAFWVVYPNPGDTAGVIRQHQADYGKIAREIRDPDHALVKMAHAKITPEAAVFVPAGHGLREVYLGRIDNRYIDFGRQRPHATRHDLQNAISAVLQGRPAPPPDGPPVGCFLVSQP